MKLGNGVKLLVVGTVLVASPGVSFGSESLGLSTICARNGGAAWRPGDCAAYGGAKQVGYSPDLQEAVSVLQSIQEKVKMPALSPNLQAAISEHRKKMIDANQGKDEFTDLEVLQDYVKSSSKSAE
jgi:hypothetical protein